MIGRGTWLDSVAAEIIKREKSLTRSTSLIRVESGLGASGIPHVGSLGDAIRSYGIKLSLEDIGYKSELIAYSDDYDGLRKVPTGFPDWLNEFIGSPVSLIRDPFECHKSYGEHMSSILLDALDKLSVSYRFQSGSDAYREGLLSDQVVKILENSSKIGDYIASQLGQTKFEKVLPYYPLCEKCQRLYVAEAYNYDPETFKVKYRCSGAEIQHKKIKGCGHEGETDVRKGLGKLSWKSEMAARWAAFDIRFEAFGKDIADSVIINDWVSDEVLKHPHPHHAKYEMFLDKSGKKISKSQGNVFTPQTWLRYGTPQSLILLMFKRISGTRSLAVEDIPTYMDEYDYIEDIYFGAKKVGNPSELRKMKGLYEYINSLKTPNTKSPHIPYRLLTQLASMAPTDSQKDWIVKKLISYRQIKEGNDKLTAKIELATNWSKDFPTTAKAKVNLSNKERKVIQKIAQVLRTQSDPTVIQSEIFEAAKENQAKPSDIFPIIYQILLGSNRGPRLGPYSIDIGREKVAGMLEEALK